MRSLIRSLLPLLGALSSAVAAAPLARAAAEGRPVPGLVRVRLVTSEGAIVVALDAKRAPATTANFLAYVDDGRFDGTFFYRAARREGATKQGFIQGGIDTDARRALNPVILEPTSKTGLRHLDGTISMARSFRPVSATGNFTLEIGPAPDLDAHGTDLGYAAFGKVVAGMDAVRRILAKPSGGGEGAMRGQMIFRPVRIVSARRLDGMAKPTAGPKPWLIWAGRK